MIANGTSIDAGTAGWDRAATAMFRAAQAVSHPGGQTLFEDLVRELADILGVATAFVAVFTDESRSTLRTLAVILDGRMLRVFEYPLEGSPCAKVAGRSFRYVDSGVSAEFPPATLFGAKGMDSYAAYPLNDTAGMPIGLLVAMDRRPIGDPALVEALQKIFAGRIVAEIERESVDQALRAAALAVSSARGESVFVELMRYLASILRVECAFVSRFEPDDPEALRIVAMVQEGEVVRDLRYRIAGTPCETIVGGQFHVYPSGLRERFPDDAAAQAQGVESYAGFPMTDSSGAPLGAVSIASRQPLRHVERIESMLQIFAVRAAAELEQLRSNEALKRSEASCRAIFDSAEDAIFIHDWDTGEILDVNAKACEAYGLDREQMKRLSLEALTAGMPPPFTIDAAIERIELAKRDACPPFEWPRRERDGSIHWDEVRLKPATIDGRPHVLAFTRDVTERKEAIARLQAQREQYRAIFDGSADCLGLWDRDLRLVDVNQAFTRIRGWASEEVIGRTLVERDNERQVEQRTELIRGALSGREGRIEFQMPRADGELIDVEVRYVPVTFGGVDHALSVARDVTERRERERALQRSEARLRATVEAAFDCVIGMHSDGRIVEFNAAAERCFGRLRQDVIGRVLADVLLPERHRVAFARGLARFHETGRSPLVGQLVETTALRADGTEIPAELAISVAEVPGEGCIFVGYLRDISARRAAEAERAALEAQLRQAQKMEAIGQLTGGIAHDFNNILTSVLGYLVLAQDRAAGLADAALSRQLGQAELAAQRARDLIAQMLAFARRQRGESRPVALVPLVQRSLQLLRSTLPASVSVDEPVVPHGCGQTVSADAVQLEQVLFNLCINARDAMRGSGRIRVRVNASRGGWRCASCRAVADARDWLELSVSDTGPGIAPDVVDRMFEPFFSTKEIGQGSGMGLAMVHGIVHDHGGHVVVDTAAGAGTTFRVMLPSVDARIPGLEAALVGAAPRRAPDGPPLAGRVMVVEDEPMVGDFMAELLESWGLEVVLMRDPGRAVDWLETRADPLDLLITDLTMPLLTGLDVSARARDLRPELPVVLYTGNAETADTTTLQRHGVRAVLPKPVDAEALRALVRRWVDPTVEPGAR
jgi:PAS domain S-box-containing protein